MTCIDGSALGWYPSHHRRVDLSRGRSEGAKGAVADDEGHKDVRGFQFKIFALCYITSFDEVRPKPWPLVWRASPRHACGCVCAAMHRCLRGGKVPCASPGSVHAA